MVDGGPEKVKIGSTIDGGDEEMTVVVPPPKSSKLAGDHGRDEEGDVAMEGTEKTAAEGQDDEQLDPKVKAVAGSYNLRIF